MGEEFPDKGGFTCAAGIGDDDDFRGSIQSGLHYHNISSFAEFGVENASRYSGRWSSTAWQTAA